MSKSFRLTTDRFPPASLGCGTLIVIALIVWIISSAGYQKTGDELKSLRTQVEELKRSVDAQSDQIRGLKELIQRLGTERMAPEAQPKK